MRRPWIKVETATPDKPEICAIATALRMDEDAVIGKLVRLWSWVEVNHAPANDLGVTKEFLDKLVGRKGFSNAMIACGWLLDNDGKLSLRNLERHNGGSAKVRALTAQRVALHRQKKRVSERRNVAKPLHVESDKAPAAVGVNDAIDVKSVQEALSSNEENDAQNIPVKPALADEVTAVHAEVAHEEPAAKKHRSRPTNDPDQPLLF